MEHWLVHPSRNSSTGEIPNSQSNLVEHTYRSRHAYLAYLASGTGWALYSGNPAPCEDPRESCTTQIPLPPDRAHDGQHVRDRGLIDGRKDPWEVV